MADALLAALGAGFALACPAFPANARSVYQGHLFVGGALLNESGMENHPLTPMTDANLVRVLSRQTDGTVGLVPYAEVDQGAAAIRRAMTALAEQGRRYAIVDAVSDRHLVAIGEAAAAHALITGGSGVAMGLGRISAAPVCCRSGPIPARCRRCPGRRRCWPGRARARRWGRSVSPASAFRCSNSIRWPHPTRRRWRRGAIAWAAGRLGATPIVIAASAPPDKVAAVQQALGRDAAGALIEEAMARIAAALVMQGVRHLVVAGGETAGAVVSRLGVRSLRIGGEIDPGVPWTYAEGDNAPLLVALKSGNFGARDFFLKAFDAPGKR